MKVLAVMMLGLSVGAFADAWVWFDLCKHRTGEAVGQVQFKGMDTQGNMFRNTQDIRGIIPLLHDKCVILDLEEGNVAVKGSLQEVWCKIRQGPGCNAK